MAKQRFRELKQKKYIPRENQSNTPKHLATAKLKIKAFLTDAFMLLMPIMYIVFYLVMGGREGFATHKLIGWIAILIPLVIAQTLFMYYTSQTPGYRAYNLKVIDANTQQKPSLFSIIFRNLCAVLSFLTLIGWVMMFLRKDRKTLHDLLSATEIVTIDAPQT
ncbi:FIG00732228: membrane protein [hydrothermal vent metagenome]|uniref:FIG00732228: membrane protein n=1 Tax=hydrothermal vent metagenome TaxID=652676 RepID=A0A1W1BRN5_9ZZZZ